MDDFTPAQARVPVPQALRGATKIPPALDAALAKAGFDVALDGDELVFTRTGIVMIDGDPGAQAPDIEKPIEGQELRNLSGFLAAHEASLST